MACVDISNNSDLLITQYNSSPKLHAIVDGLNAVVQTAQLNTLCQFEKGMALDHATGWLLDRIGHNHGTALLSDWVQGNTLVLKKVASIMTAHAARHGERSEVE